MAANAIGAAKPTVAETQPARKPTAGLKMRDILGYTTVTCLAAGLVFAATMLIVGAG